MPAWPLGSTYTKGLLGIDQRDIVTDQLREATAERATWVTRVESSSYNEIQADPNLMRIVEETGPRLFGDNCAACHGVDAKGAANYPDLTDADWLWGGEPETIAETMRVGAASADSLDLVGRWCKYGNAVHRDGKGRHPAGDLCRDEKSQ